MENSFKKDFFYKIFIIKFLKKKLIKINSPYNILSMVPPSGKLPMNELIKNNCKKNYHYFYSIFKSFLKSFCKIEINLKFKKINDYEKIIISWLSDENLKKNLINDHIFNIPRKEQKILKVLITNLNFKNINLKDDNILLCSIEKKISLLTIIFKLMKLPFYFFKTDKLEKIYHFHSNESYILLNKIKFIFEKKKINKVLFAYEGQMFQNCLINYIKKFKKNIQTIGYVHTSTSALPLNLFKTKFSPDKLIVNSKNLQNILIKYFGWSDKKISLLPSLRYRIKKKYIQNGYIYFPININDINDFNKKFSLLIEKKKFNKYKKLNYKFHPQSNQIFAYKQKAINKNVQSIFYSSTGSIIQYIQERKNALHVTESSFYEFYNPLIWTYLKAQKVSNNVFHYKLKKGKNIILYGNNLDYKNYIY